jgi:hypothetical protein
MATAFYGEDTKKGRDCVSSCINQLREKGLVEGYINYNGAEIKLWSVKQSKWLARTRIDRAKPAKHDYPKSEGRQAGLPFDEQAVRSDAKTDLPIRKLLNDLRDGVQMVDGLLDELAAEIDKVEKPQLEKDLRALLAKYKGDK